MPFFDRVAETSTSSGTGNFTLAGAITGYRTFASVFDLNLMLKYAIVAVDGSGAPTGDWEVGRGYLSGSTTLVRDIVESSSNAGALVSFAGATTKQVFNQIGALAARQAQISFNLQYGMP